MVPFVDTGKQYAAMVTHQNSLSKLALLQLGNANDYQLLVYFGFQQTG
jgi:hypothetical protein